MMYDVIIIGSGPAGLSAAVYAQRACLKCVIAEKLHRGTGQISEGGKVDNYPGIYGVSGFELGEKFRSHAESLGAEFYEGEAVSITPLKDVYKVSFSDGNAFDTRTIIYAAGTSRRRLGVPGEAELTGKGVSYCAVCDGAFYKNKTVAVIGGGDTALGDAEILSSIAEKVYLIHRRSEFRAGAALQKRVSKLSNVECLMNSTVSKISGEGKVRSLTVSYNAAEREIPVDGVFVAVGSSPNSGLLKGIAELDSSGYVIAGEDGKTTAKGIFAAGDVRVKSLRQVVTAAADGANCADSAERYIFENK